MFGNVDAVRKLILKYTDEITEEEVRLFLSMATRKIQAKYSTEYWDKFCVNWLNNAPSRDFPLYFSAKRNSPALDVTAYIFKVVVGTDVIDDEEYTINDDKTVVTLSDEVYLSDSDYIYIYYFPEVFDDLATYMAAKTILLSKTANVGENSTIPAFIKNINDEIESLDSAVRNKPDVVPVVMHRDKVGIY